MKKKIVGICVVTLFIATAVLPAVGTMNIIIKNKTITRGPIVEWWRYYGGNEFDEFRCVQQTKDGGYIAFGEYEENDMNYARLLKTDLDGYKVWSVINYDINGSGMDEDELMNYLIETSDGGYLASGYQSFYYNEGDVWDLCGFLWKVDKNGKTEWVKYYYDLDEITYNIIFQMTEVEDGYIGGGLMIDIEAFDQPDYDMNFSVIKVDFDGNLVMNINYGFGGYEFAISFDITSDGGYFLSGGYSDDSILFDDDDGILIMKADSNGNMEWYKLFDGPIIDFSAARGCCQTSDGGYIIIGATQSYSAINGGKWDIWLIKTDSTGNKLWEKFFGGEGYENCWSMQMTSDGGYIFAIDYNQGGSGSSDDIWIVKTDEMGNVEWDFLFNYEDREVPIFIDQTSDGELIIGGRTGNPDAKSTDSFIIKISSFNNDRPTKPVITGPQKGKPDKDYTFTASSSDPNGDRIVYMWDWGDGNYSEWDLSTKAMHNWNAEGAFEIKVMAKDSNGGQSEWSDPFKFSISRNKAIIFNSLLMKILERFPFLD